MTEIDLAAQTMFAELLRRSLDAEFDASGLGFGLCGTANRFSDDMARRR